MAKTNGVIALFGFREIRINKSLDDFLYYYLQDLLKPYWRNGKKLYDDKYQSLDFPYELIAAPSFFIENNWLPSDVLNLIDSYSAAQEYLDHHGYYPSHTVKNQFLSLWGDPTAKRLVSIPIYMKVGRIK